MTETSEAPRPADRMAAIRTELAFQRTRIAVDRTMMAFMRTSVSLIGFGFTIFSIFRSLADPDLLGRRVPPGAPAYFGLAFVSLGVVLLAFSIYTDMKYMKVLRKQREWLVETGLMEGLADIPRSLAVLGAILLLLLGVAAIGVILLDI
ncbi:MAG: YidH family protein [Sandaracinobacteroides sp.]